MRVLHTAPGLELDAGGPSRTVPGLCAALAEQGVNVELLTVGTPGRIQELSDRMPSVRVRSASSEPIDLLGLRFRSAVNARAAGRDLNLIHDHGLWTGANHWAAQAARTGRIPRIVSPRGMLEPWSLGRKALKKRLALIMYQSRDIRSARVIHATSQLEAGHLRELGLRGPIAVIPNGVAIPERSVRLTRSDVPRTLLFLSRIHPKKGVLELIDAWAGVRADGWRLIVAGSGQSSYLAQLRARVRDLGLDNDISFVGAVEGKAKAELFAQADLFVLPSFSENFGVVVAEALASEVPVITTRATPWEELELTRSGWSIDIGVTPLIGALRVATSTPSAQLTEMGRRGRRLVEERYTWPSIAKAMAAVYDWVLGGGSPPECVDLCRT